MLTARDIDRLEPKAKPYRVADSRNLSLRVDPNGAKYWIGTKIRAGKRSTVSLGKWPEVSAVEARRRLAEVNTPALRAGVGMTFAELYRLWLALKETTLTSTKYALQIDARMQSDVLPVIGKTDVAQIKRRELIAIVQAVAERDAVETAKRLAQYIRQALDYAVDCGLIESHAGGNLSRVLPSVEKSHHAAVPLDAAPAMFAQLWAYHGSVVVVGAIRLLALTALRSRELAGGRWDEINGDVWVIPAARMKRRLPHVVPLSTQALAELERLRAVAKQSEFIFPSHGGHIHPETPSQIIRRITHGKQTAHGLRSVFSSAANQSGLWHADAIERQLAHKETDAIRAAYHRAEYLDERKRLMQWWADGINNQPNS